jgi:hypothetical protein
MWWNHTPSAPPVSEPLSRSNVRVQELGHLSRSQSGYKNPRGKLLRGTAAVQQRSQRIECLGSLALSTTPSNWTRSRVIATSTTHPAMTVKADLRYRLTPRPWKLMGGHHRN